MALPSATALLDKMTGMTGNALAYRDEQLAKLIDKIPRKETREQCLPMLKLCRAETKKVQAFEAQRLAGSETRESTEQIQYLAQKRQSEKVVHAILRALSNTSMTTLDLKIAVDPSDSKILTGYESDLSEADHALLRDAEKVLGHTVFATLLNEHLFLASGVISQDSQLVQASSRYNIKTDPQGQPIPATPAQIDRGLWMMRDSLSTHNIACDVTRKDYKVEAARLETAEKAPAPAAQAEATQAPKTPDEPISTSHSG